MCSEIASVLNLESGESVSKQLVMDQSGFCRCS